MKREITTKEYEALATMRDVAVILYREISENIGHDSECLAEAYMVLNRLTEDASKTQF